MPSEFDSKSETGSNMESVESMEDLGDDSGNRQIGSENEQTEEERLSKLAFSIPLILKEILMHLEIEDLQQTSLVNKHWNFISREILRESNNCLAIIEGTNFCQNLNRLIALLQNSETVPFNGILLAAPWMRDRDHQCVTHGDVSELINCILRKIDIKYLGLEFYYPVNSDCIALECIREIIVKKANSLEQLSVSQDLESSQTFAEFVGLKLQGQWLPNVRFLEFPSDDSNINKPFSMIKDLVKASPKLQQLCGSIATQCLQFILPLKVAKVVKDFSFIPTINSLGSCAAFSLVNPQLHGLSFSTEGSEDETRFSDWSKFHQNEVCRILKQLLRSSQDSLKNLTCDMTDLVLMTFRWKIPILKKFTNLSMDYDSRMDEDEGYSVLRKIEWEKYFPNLKEVNFIGRGLEGIDKDFYIGGAFRESNEQFVCASVKIFRVTCPEAGEVQMFKNTFPNLKECHLKLCEGQEFPSILNELWTGWRDLEFIYLSVVLEELFPNFDSIFLGISEEEAAYLLENVEDLESLEIVSITPSIFNLRKLMKLEMPVMHPSAFCRGTNTISDKDFLSRLTGQCAFARVPGLEVKMSRVPCEPEQTCYFTLDHLKPFVKCVDLEFDAFFA